MILPYIIRFSDGSKIEIFSRNKEAAILAAQELVKGKKIVLVAISPEWN